MLIGRASERKQYQEITLLHIIGAVMILLCHFFQKAKIAALGELFITGVPLFLFVSGFLAGLKEKADGKWLAKRAKRVLIPFYVWVIPCMLILWLYNKSLVTPLQFSFVITNLQGLNYVFWPSNLYKSVAGLGHLWFITEIMLCFILTPLFFKCYDKVTLSKKGWAIIIVILVAVVQPILMFLGFQTSYIITFFLGCLAAKLGCEINTKIFVNITVICLAVNAVRFICMRFIDGSDYYDRYFALVSSAAVGIWVFFFVFWVGKVRPSIIKRISENKAVAYLSEISYEIFIVHFWFLNGTWQVSKYIDNMILADVIVVILTVAFASLLHFVVTQILKLANKKRYRI